MCVHQPADGPDVKRLLEGLPTNWGKWGPDDEVGALNYLQAEQVMRGIGAVRQGKTFTLQVDIGHAKGEPLFPGRRPSMRMNVLDKGHFLAGKAHFDGNVEYADDVIFMHVQGSTQCDALGHVWYDDKLWNGYDALSTVGSMDRASILPIAERGIAGRAVLIDIARHRNKRVLDKGETFDHHDLLAAARAQNVTIEPRDILLIRTGWIGSFYERDEAEFYRDYIEPGLTFSPELVEWFRDMEIPNLVTDTMGNEVTVDPVSGVMIPLHNALMRNLGVVFTEVVLLDELAEDCARDGQWHFLYTAAPLKIVGGTGAPVNPLVIK
ncbi:cyclase family protein [Burkholderia anthina]|uniref:cyclase family protein n=1 Tax=Burkholderia anthina TaxID=179879 RepID=UPI0015891B5A|nr:cyclase family protein [Burkholderia anthina]